MFYLFQAQNRVDIGRFEGLAAKAGFVVRHVFLFLSLCFCEASLRFLLMFLQVDVVDIGDAVSASDEVAKAGVQFWPFLTVISTSVCSRCRFAVFFECVG